MCRRRRRLPPARLARSAHDPHATRDDAASPTRGRQARPEDGRHRAGEHARRIRSAVDRRDRDGGLHHAARRSAPRPNGLATLAAPPGADPAALDRTVRFLQEMQNADGGFGGVRGAASDPGISAWAALALAANGINPFDQAKPGGTDAATYVLRTTSLRVTTDYERVALMAIAAGIPLRDFNGTDLVARDHARAAAERRVRPRRRERRARRAASTTRRSRSSRSAACRNPRSRRPCATPPTGC